MRHFAFIIMLLCSVTTITAQDQANAYISLSAGPNFPLGKYADANDGDAQTGGGFTISGAYYFKSNFGIGGKLGVSINSIEDPEVLTIEGTDFYTTKIGSWGNGYILIGPQAAIKSGAFQLDSRLLLGILNSSEPKFEARTIDYSVNLENNEAAGDALGVNIGTTARYNISDVFSLGVAIDYITGKPSIETTLTATGNGKTQSNTNEYSQNVDFISTHLSVVFNLGTK